MYSIKDKEYYLRNKDKINIRAKVWQKANPERVREIRFKSRKSDPARKLLNTARARSKQKGLEFSIVKEDICIPEFCPLLNIKLDVNGSPDTSPSLDRKDNTKGYTPDNIWVISFKANRMKNTASLEELKTFCENYLKL